jgi:signal transduction histidine kinase/ligand-binding sensor domain-containing protein
MHPGQIHAQPLPVEVLPVTESPLFVKQNWQLDEGLPQISVNGVFQSKSGYLWITTFGGLVRYDGLNFRVYNRSSNPEMVSDRTLQVTEDNRGVLWIGTENGLLRFENNRFYETRSRTARGQINQLLSDQNGTVWFYQRDGEVGFIRADTMVVLFKKTGWLGHDNRTQVHFFDQKNIIRLSATGRGIDSSVTLPKPLPKNVRFFTQDLRNTWWFVSNDSGMYRYKNGRLSLVDAVGGLPSTYANHLFHDPEGTLWVLSNKNIFRIKDDIVEKLRTVHPMPEDAYKWMIRDREGSLWVGSPSNGLFRLRESFVETIGRSQGMNIQNMLSITFDKFNTLWYSTNCEGIGRIRQGRAENLQKSYPLQNNCPWSLMFDYSGALWVASRGITVFNPDGKSTFYDAESGLTSTTVRAMLEMPDSTVWAGTAQGITVFKNGRVTTQLPRLGPVAQPDVRVLLRAADGTIWAGTQDGPVHISGEAITAYTAIPGLKSHYIRSITQDSTGALWFGTYGGGIVRLKNGSFSIISTREGLFDDIVSHLLPDGLGNFWSGSNRGISRISIRELNAVADGLASHIHPQVLGKQYGLLNVETNGGYQPSAVSGPDGNLYFPTVSGIAVINPGKVRSNTVTPPVFIDRVIHNTDVLETPASLEYDHHPFFLEIHYTALSFVDPSKVKFRYKLEGYDRNWVDAGARRTAFYSNLPPGDYTFTVLSANNDGLWNETGASLSVVIHPPFWLKPWFILVAAATVALTVFTFYAARIRQLKKRQLMQQQFARELITSQENERKRIANELHDGIGHHMMMIKNRLRMLERAFPASKPPEEWNQTLESTETAIAELRSIAQNLRPVHLERFGLTETLRNMISGLISSTEIEVSAEIDELDEAVGKGLDIHLYRLLQEALNNIVKHAKATELTVSVRLDGVFVAIDVTDNGVGFDITKHYQGSGLQGMEERTRLLGGRFYLQSVPGQGTRLQCIIPTRL